MELDAELSNRLEGFLERSLNLAYSRSKFGRDIQRQQIKREAGGG